MQKRLQGISIDRYATGFSSSRPNSAANKPLQELEQLRKGISPDLLECTGVTSGTGVADGYFLRNFKWSGRRQTPDVVLLSRSGR